MLAAVPVGECVQPLKSEIKFQESSKRNFILNATNPKPPLNLPPGTIAFADDASASPPVQAPPIPIAEFIAKLHCAYQKLIGEHRSKQTDLEKHEQSESSREGNRGLLHGVGTLFLLKMLQGNAEEVAGILQSASVSQGTNSPVVANTSQRTATALLQVFEGCANVGSCGLMTQRDLVLALRSLRTLLVNQRAKETKAAIAVVGEKTFGDAVQTLKLLKGISDKKFAAIADLADTNASGKVSFVEFLHAFLPPAPGPAAEAGAAPLLRSVSQCGDENAPPTNPPHCSEYDSLIANLYNNRRSLRKALHLRRETKGAKN